MKGLGKEFGLSHERPLFFRLLRPVYYLIYIDPPLGLISKSSLLHVGEVMWRLMKSYGVYTWVLVHVGRIDFNSAWFSLFERILEV